MVLENYEPKIVFKYFEEISNIPRGSGNEKQISDYLVAFAQARGLEVIQDEALNVIIKKAGTKGYENSPTVILQGHMDMVCEKNRGVEHDFLEDPLKLVVEGDLIKADGTTLGADNGIAIAMGLALLDSSELQHPPIELLVTTDEERGMSGGEKVDVNMLNGRMLINLDSEEEGEFLTSCAGGMRAYVKVNVKFTNLPEHYTVCELSVRGLSGGHSGADIHKERANSNRIMSRALLAIMEKHEILVCKIEGGSKENAIPREADCLLAFKDVEFEAVTQTVGELEELFKNEYKFSDKNLSLTMKESHADVERVFSNDSAKKIIATGLMLPLGVQSMSMAEDLKGLVESSVNIGVVSTNDNVVQFACSLRSSVVSRKYLIMEQIKAVAKAVGAEFECMGDYPAWEFNKDSKLQKIFEAEYENFTGKKAEIKGIHAGLECGLFAKVLNNPDMISMGPNITGAHSPEESLSISSTFNVWNFLKHVLSKMN